MSLSKAELELLVSIRDTVGEVREKVDSINEHGCSKREGDLKLIEGNSFWIRLGIVGIITSLVGLIGVIAEAFLR